jgi:hypothetical protein
MSGPSYVSLKELARTLGMDRSHARRYVLGLGFKPVKQRTADSGNQLALAVRRAQADGIVKRRREQGFLSSGGQPVNEEHGCFYFVQLVPDLEPRRVKLGFAFSISDRLSQHRTAAPTAAVLRTWPCRRAWEPAALDCLAQGGRRVGPEVFDCDDLDRLMERADAFFRVMPQVSNARSTRHTEQRTSHHE